MTMTIRPGTARRTGIRRPRPVEQWSFNGVAAELDAWIAGLRAAIGAFSVSDVDPTFVGKVSRGERT